MRRSGRARVVVPTSRMTAGRYRLRVVATPRRGSAVVLHPLLAVRCAASRR